MTYSWQLYISDDSITYAVKVEEAYVAMPERGWFSAAVSGDLQYPRGWRLRRAVGLTPDGRLVYADCARVSADLWTGAVSEFTYIDQGGAHVRCTVIRRDRERRLLIPAATLRGRIAR